LPARQVHFKSAEVTAAVTSASNRGRGSAMIHGDARELLLPYDGQVAFKVKNGGDEKVVVRS
jgi:hypothetical protein